MDIQFCKILQKQDFLDKRLTLTLPFKVWLFKDKTDLQKLITEFTFLDTLFDIIKLEKENQALIKNNRNCTF